MQIFDSHLHIIDPDFPLVENNGYLPPAFTADDYLRQTHEYGITGGAIVSGSFQEFDQSYLLAALKKLGRTFYGVANIPVSISAEELKTLDEAGVVAVRFNLKRGGSEKVEHIEYLSNRLFNEYGWHTELYVDSGDLPDLKSSLLKIPKFSIDHLGLSLTGQKDLYDWVEKGVKVKATGFGRIDFPALPVMKTIHSINPEALMFGTDLPSTRAKIAFSRKDIDLIIDNFPESDLTRIFYENAREWYARPV